MITQSKPLRRLRKAPRWAKVAFVVWVCIDVLIIFWLLNRTPEPLQAANLTITNPEIVEAGERFTVEITGAQPDEEVRLTVDAGYGPRLMVAEPQVGVRVFDVAGSSVAESGLVLLQATSATATGWSQMEILPVSAVDPLDLFLGPRTVVADNDHHSMIVAVPTDRFGNPVATGTPVDFDHFTPTGEKNVQQVPTKHLLAYVELPAGSTSGRSRVAVSVGQASGRGKTFLEVAGVTAPFTLATVDPLLFADGSTLVRVETSELVDQFDNQLPDGTLAFLRLDGEKETSGSGSENAETRRLSAVTIDGVATFILESPSEPTSLVGRGESGGTESDPLELEFGPAVSEFPVDTKRVVVESGAPATEIRVGPVLTVDGSFVPNGTMAVVTTKSSEIEVAFDNGVATTQIDLLDGDVDISVLGVLQVAQITES